MKFATVLVETCEVSGLLGTIYKASISACGLLGIVSTGVHCSLTQSMGYSTKAHGLSPNCVNGIRHK